jgi:hypothetical protein
MVLRVMEASIWKSELAASAKGEWADGKYGKYEISGTDSVNLGDRTNRLVQYDRWI